MGPSRPLLIRYPFLRALYLFCIWWIITLATLTILYFAWIRDYQMFWGATAEDISRHMPGDELLVDPQFNSTRAVEIDATTDQVWPWVVQMGYSRGGFYGFDRLDNGGNRSAERIIPECQNLKVGDSLASGEYKGKLFNFLEVVEIEPDSVMLWVFVDTPWKGATWSWGVYRIGDGRTKLVSRLRNAFEVETTEEKILCGFIDVMEIFMMRTTLLGIKRRVEGT